MESKYYTPDISEFHVGFEYETLSVGKTEWISEIFDNKANIKEYEQTLNRKEIRVKYLDREDIEELGFKKHPDWDEENKKYIDHYVKGDVTIYYNTHNGELYSCLIASSSPLNRDSYLWFNIKNKSELDKIWKIISS